MATLPAGSRLESCHFAPDIVDRDTVVTVVGAVDGIQRCSLQPHYTHLGNLQCQMLTVELGLVICRHPVHIPKGMILDFAEPFQKPDGSGG